MVRLLIGTIIVLGSTWLLVVCTLVLVRPRGIDVVEAKRLVPDLLRLLKALAQDPTLPAGVRRRLALLLVYLAVPFDLVPDFVPVLGYADDVIVVALVLRGVVRRAGSEALERHWTGTAAGLSLVRSITGVA